MCTVRTKTRDRKDYLVHRFIWECNVAIGAHASVALMGKNKNISNRAEMIVKPSRTRSIVKQKTVVPVKFNPKSLTELASNKLEQMINTKTTKLKSLVQQAAEKNRTINQTINYTVPNYRHPLWPRFNVSVICTICIDVPETNRTINQTINQITKTK